MKPDQALIVFAREPRLGRVKGRLAAESSAQTALAIYERLLARCLRLARVYVRQTDPRCHLIVSVADPVGRGDYLSEAACRYQAEYQVQPEGDLGQRMRASLAASLSAGAKRVVLIGVDCPGLGLADLRAAFTGLAEHDLVLTPTHDGGYCLIGVRADWPGLFTSMAWGSDQVRADTLTRATAAGLDVLELPAHSDIDYLNDWRSWCAARARRGLPEETDDISH